MSNQHKKYLTLTDLDETWFLHMSVRHSLIVSFSIVCCMASELESAKSQFFTKFWLTPWYLINHNFKHDQLYDLQFAPFVTHKISFHLV